MSEEIVMPRLSDTMDRGTIAHWTKKAGDQVKRGDVLLEIETDKANMELESYSDGILARIMVDEGETAPVGTPIGLVAKDEAELKQIEGSAGPSKQGQTNEVEAAPKTTGDGVVESGGGSPTTKSTRKPTSHNGKADESQSMAMDSNGRVKASPLARRIAQQRGLDLTSITGSGPGGRIVREDVESVEAGSTAAPSRGE